MNNFEDLKEYSFIDLAKSKVTNLMTMGKSGIDKAKSFLEEREDAVEIIVAIDVCPVLSIDIQL